MTHTKAQRPFINAIIAAPDDDAPRLVYADWLDENDGTEKCTKCNGEGWVYTTHRLAEMDQDERCSTSARCEVCDGKGSCANKFADLAEFIRVQCELANNNNCDITTDRIELLKHRQEQLLGFTHGGESMRHYNWKDWCGNVVNCAYRSIRKEDVLKIFRRGFVEQISCSMSHWMMHGPDIVRLHPITRVLINNKRPFYYFDLSGYYWANGKLFEQGREDLLPHEIFKRLNKKSSRNLLFFTANYGVDIKSAINDLSQACIAWAKAIR